MEEPLSKLSQSLITFFEKDSAYASERTIKVNPIVSTVVTWYEKFRSSMEYHEEEVVIRVSIERILRRRLLLGGKGETTAEPLIRELIWGGYFQDDTVPQSSIEKTKDAIDNYLLLRHEVLKHRKIRESILNEWIYQLMACEIEQILGPDPKTEAMGNFMYRIIKNQVAIADDSEESKNVQVFIAVRRAFHRDDLPFLRYHLFTQYFGKISRDTIHKIAENFSDGYREINRSLNHRRKEVIYNYVRKKAPVFVIFQDILSKQGKHITEFLSNNDELKNAVYSSADVRYKTIRQKVRRAVVRSVIFILCTKLIFAFAVEGSYERLVFGKIIWSQLAINAGIPPLLMIIVGFFIKVPGIDNSKQIFSYIENIIRSDNPKLGSPLHIRLKKERNSLTRTIFSLLWFLAFFISFGTVFFILTRLHFNIVSQLVFVFFLAVVSFLSYRISLTAHLYTVIEKQNVGTFLVDFLFMPIVRVGRQLAQSVQQINFLLYIFDFIIETPFKAVFAFFEQWFGFLHAKREEME